MSLDVDVPDPPELEAVGEVGEGSDDYHREELADFLADGAWEDAFQQWAAETAIDETEYDVVRDLGLLDQFDFFWDDFVSRVGYNAPGIPEDWREREIHPDLENWETVSGINAALAELGRITGAILTEEYADWGNEEELGEELPDFD
jgi:hypothetical protein